MTVDNDKVVALTVENLDGGDRERYVGVVFVDATYEGDLTVTAGVPYRIGREGADKYGEPLARKVYAPWVRGVDGTLTGRGDNAIPAYNYRLCLTPDEGKLPIERSGVRPDGVLLPCRRDSRRRPHLRRRRGVHAGGNRVDGESRAAAERNGRREQQSPDKALDGPSGGELAVSKLRLEWRDEFAERLQNLHVGVALLPPARRCGPRADAQTGMPSGGPDEYADNGYFHWQAYVRN